MSNTLRSPGESLDQADPLIARLNRYEADRQNRKLIMIASESICPPPVREALSSELANIYAEGYPSPRMWTLDESALEAFDETFVEFRRYGDRRYYKGCDYVNVVEAVAKRRLSMLFATDAVPHDQLYANVQPLSGAAANNAVYNAFLRPGDRIMGMDLTCGGHLTHGSEVNRSGRTYHIGAYRPASSGALDYAAMEKQAREFRPALIVAGFSAYPWDIDWPALRTIADQVGAILHADIAHTAGLVAAGVLRSPVGHAHVISFTTHKSLCGPRGAAILTTDPEHAARVDLGVFPGEQGGPHIHQIAAKAVAFDLARQPTFQALMRDVVRNAAALAEAFGQRGVKLAYGGTDTHLCLLDLKSVKTASGQILTGEIASRVLDMCGLTCNKNTIMGDTSANQPSGLRFGTVWVTQRGFGAAHMDRIAEVVVNALRGAHAYEYHYAGGPVGRAKLDWSLLEKTRAELAALADEATDPSPGDGSTLAYPHTVTARATAATLRTTPLGEAHARASATMYERAGWQIPLHFGSADEELSAAVKGCALWDLGDAEAIRLEGGRAESLLQCALTADVRKLEQNECLSSLLLDRDGAPIDLVTVARLSAPVTEPATFLVVTRGGRGDAVTAWLRALSDGYVMQDADLLRKAEGPAVVRPLSESTSVTTLALAGPKAADTVDAALPSVALVPPGKVGRAENTLVVRLPGAEGHHVIVTPAEGAHELWTKLLEAGARPCGAEAEDRLARSHNLPAVGAETPAGRELARVYATGRVAPHKPYFVGQDTLLAETTAAQTPPQHDFAVPEQELRRTCLHAEHLKLTQKRFMVPFAGWEMPVWYQGIGAEHRAVRLGAGLFDVSHMGVLAVRGRHAERFLDLVTTNYVPWLRPGQCHYSYLLAPDGRVIDDIIIYREAEDRFMVVVNAANAEQDEAWLRAVNSGKVLIDERHPVKRPDGSARIVNLKLDESEGASRRVDLAFQGPASLPTMLRLTRDADFARRLRQLRRFELTQGALDSIGVLVARTGYTGEDVGFEIFPHPDDAPALWNLLLDAGRDLGAAPTGLGARDSTRCEAGLPLHGHELAGESRINPLEAGYAPFVRMHKPWFVGRDACVDALRSWTREVVRFRVSQRGGKKIQPGNKVVDGKRGEFIGQVTSCVSVGRVQIGLALVDRRYARQGDPLIIFPRSDRDRDPTPKALSDLGPGDKVPLTLDATVLPRFARPDDMHRDARELDA
ncbi:MAG: serine hydroxymethyltransferase [bacterium]